MKRITTIPVITLLLLTLACNAQELKTLELDYYETNTVDSLLIVIAEKDSIINEFNTATEFIGDTYIPIYDTINRGLTFVKVVGEDRWFTVDYDSVRYKLNVVDYKLTLQVGYGNVGYNLFGFDLKNREITQLNFSK